MRKFIALVKNEYIKLFVSSGTWVMVALIIAASVLIPLMGSVVSKVNVKDTVDRLSASIDGYNNEIEQEKTSKYPGWEQRVEFYNFLIEHEVLSYSARDWRYDVSRKLLAFDLTHDASLLDENKQSFDTEAYKKACKESYGKQTEDIKSAVIANDSMAFCRSMLDYNKAANPKATEAELKAINFEYQYRIDNYYPIEDTWKSRAITDYSESASTLSELEATREERGTADEAEIAKLTQKSKKLEYRIKNDIQYDLSEGYTWTQYDGPSAFTVWTLWGSTTGVTGDPMGDALLSITSIIGVFVAVIAGGIVAGEHSSGTIKSLLINPTSRRKIISAKYFTVLSLGAVFMLIGYAVSGITSLAFMGPSDASAAYLTFSDGEVSTLSGALYIAKRYLVGGINVLVYGTLGFAISSLFQSAALAVGLSLMAMLSGTIVNLIMVSAEFDWGRFLIFANTDLLMISNGSSYYQHQTISFAIGVITVHMIVFLLTAWDGFTRKDI